MPVIATNKINIKLYNADCLDKMKDMPDKIVDCCVTSPPYNMRTRIRNGQYTERENGEHFSKKYSSFSDALPIQEYYETHLQVIKEILRVSKIAFINIQLVTGSKEAWFRLLGNFAKHIKDVVVWDKGEGQPAMHHAVINRSYELILILTSNKSAGRAFDKVYFERGTMPDMWRLGRGGQGKIKGHSAVFPEALAKKIILGWSNKGHTILDPFMGSGTTGVACKLLNRNFIGIELSEEYFKIAQNRINQTEQGLF